MPLNLYFPIADININILFIVLIGVIGGTLSGMLGIGGGFITTPILMTLGISPSVSVATSANQIVGASAAGLMTRLAAKNVDLKLGLTMAIFGIIGSYIGIELFVYLKKKGNIDLIISLLYFSIMTVIAITSALDSIKTFRKRDNEDNGDNAKKKKFKLPFKMPLQVHFPVSRITISIFSPMLIGIFIGCLVSMMGIGGGFIMIPVMIYVLHVPSRVVIGTSLVQTLASTINATILHAVKTQSLDILLSSFIIIGATIGAQFGIFFSRRIEQKYLQLIFTVLILFISVKFAYRLFIAPSQMFVVETEKILWY